MFHKDTPALAMSLCDKTEGSFREKRIIITESTEPSSCHSPFIAVDAGRSLKKEASYVAS